MSTIYNILSAFYSSIESFVFIIFLSKMVGTLYLIFGGILPTLQGNLGKPDIKKIENEIHYVLESSGFDGSARQKIFTDTLAELKTILGGTEKKNVEIRRLILISMYWLFISLIEYFFPTGSSIVNLILILVSSFILIYITIMLYKIIKHMLNLKEDDQLADRILYRHIYKHLEERGIKQF